jgi:hypothetical protein
MTKKHTNNFVIKLFNPPISKDLVAANIQSSYKSYLIAEETQFNGTKYHQIYVESFENTTTTSIAKHFEEIYNAQVDVEPVSNVQKTTRSITQRLFCTIFPIQC